MKNKIGERLLFIDTETGGINPTKHSLLSIGLAVWEKKNEIIDSTEILIKHDDYIITSTAQSINKFDRKIHEISAVSSSKAISLLLDFCRMYFDNDSLIPLAGHNTQFDVGFLKIFLKSNRRSFNELFSHRIIDTYTLLRSLYYAGKISEDISSSAQAFSYFDLKVDGRHTAKGDALATAKLYSKLLGLL